MKIKHQLFRIKHKINHHLTRLVWFARKKMPPAQLLAVLSIVVGLLTALMALVLKQGVSYFENMVSRAEPLSNAASSDWLSSLLRSLPMVITPAIGILLTILLIRWFVRDDISHGLSKVLKSIAVGEGKMPWHASWSYVAACSLTAGFGGSVGMEAPIVATGSGIGANIAKLFRLGYRYRVILIGCGAAAGVSAVFKAPIAGLILAIEVLAIDVSAWAILPLLLASASAAVLSMALTDKTNEFAFAVTENFVFTSIPWYVVLGLICGFISLAFTRLSWRFEDVLRAWSKRKRFFLGASLVGILVFLFPPLFGEGYAPMKALLSGHPGDLSANPLIAPLLGTLSSGNEWLSGWFFLAYLVAIILLKLIATPMTTGAGGIGGIFAPSLFLGCFAGYAFGLFVQQSGLVAFFGAYALSTQNLALVGMAGVMAGVVHAPLTSIFLIAEITGGYELLIPLIVTSAISHYTIRRFEKHSVYTRRLAADGHLVTNERDKSALALLHPKQFIRTDAPQVSPSTTLARVVELVRRSNSEILVVADEQRFFGFIFVDHIREVMFVPESYQLVCAQDLMEIPKRILYPEQSMTEILDDFSALSITDSSLANKPGSGSDSFQYLPVIDRNGAYLGYLRHTDILEAYRKKIIDISGTPEQND